MEKIKVAKWGTPKKLFKKNADQLNHLVPHRLFFHQPRSRAKISFPQDLVVLNAISDNVRIQQKWSKSIRRLKLSQRSLHYVIITNPLKNPSHV